MIWFLVGLAVGISGVMLVLFLREEKKEEVVESVQENWGFRLPANDLIRDPVRVDLMHDQQFRQAMKRVQQAAVDVQGMVSLMSRYIVATAPPEVWKDMDPPSEWAKGGEE